MKTTALLVAALIAMVPAAAQEPTLATEPQPVPYDAPSLKDRLIEWCKEHPDNARCDRLKDVYAYCRDHPDDVRCDDAKCRAAHVAAKRIAWRINHAIDGLEHRVVVLEFAEKRVREAIGQEYDITYETTAGGQNVAVTGTFAPDDEDLEKKLERIQAAQDKLLEKIEDLHEKRAELRERWSNFKQDTCDLRPDVPIRPPVTDVDPAIAEGGSVTVSDEPAEADADGTSEDSGDASSEAAPSTEAAAPSS